MATLTAEPQTHPPSEADAKDWQPARRLFTVDEYYALYEHGIIDDDERTELIEGEIYVMTPPRPQPPVKSGCRKRHIPYSDSKSRRHRPGAGPRTSWGTHPA